LIIQKLELKGFRNLIDVSVSFSPQKSLIFGLNGAGKTSILEAMFTLGFGKSFLGTKKSDQVNFDMNFFLLRMEVLNRDILTELSASFKKNSFHLYLNEKNVTVLELSEYFYPIFFSSSDYNRTIDSITEMRKMVNRFIFGVQSLYIHYILSYNKILKQKNVLLKTTKNVQELSSWNYAISEMSSKIIQARVQFIDQLNQEIENIFGRELRIHYKPSFDTKQGITDDILFQKLERIRHLEIKYQKSMIGPHLDGFEFNLKSKNLKFYSSGERKIHLLMIYIAFIEFFRRLKSQPPVFLIDDFDTTFDNKNLEFLLENCPDIQLIASSVHEFKGFDHLIELKNGDINQREQKYG
jgi:DNA replication and repair protein RecF